jgi:hypothetical protein
MDGDGPRWTLEPIVLYPSQVKMFEADGWVRGRDFIVYSCLKCREDMDRCKCKPEPK